MRKSLMAMSFDTPSDPGSRVPRVRMVLFDSDGVLTDGGVYIDEVGTQMRRFDIKDGAGIARLVKGGWIVGVVSASSVEVVRGRMEGLGATEIHLGVPDKVVSVEGILAKHGLGWDELAFMGDDRADIGVLRRVGLAGAPADAVEEVLAVVNWVSRCPGGKGAAREFCDLIAAG